MHTQPEGEFRNLGSSFPVPAQILGSAGQDQSEEAKRGLDFQVPWLASQPLRWLDFQHTNPRVANWALTFAMLAVYFIFRHLQLFAVISALTSVYCVHQAAFCSIENPHRGGKKRAKVAQFLSYAVLMIGLFQAMST